MHTRRKAMQTGRHGNCIFFNFLNRLLLHLFIALNKKELVQFRTLAQAGDCVARFQ
jgi:hypothetical protein